MMNKKQKGYLLFAVLLGIGIGYYVYTAIMEKVKRKKATVELAAWMPASHQVYKIHKHLDSHNRKIIESAAEVICACAERYVQDFSPEEVEAMNSADLMTNMMPFIECIQKKAKRSNLENLEESYFNEETQYYYNQIDKEIRRSVFLFLMLIEMKAICVSDSYLFMKLIREEYEGK